jgi:hypothetical protein
MVIAHLRVGLLSNPLAGANESALAGANESAPAGANESAPAGANESALPQHTRRPVTRARTMVLTPGLGLT